MRRNLRPICWHSTQTRFFTNRKGSRNTDLLNLPGVLSIWQQTLASALWTMSKFRNKCGSSRIGWGDNQTRIDNRRFTRKFDKYILRHLLRGTALGLPGVSRCWILISISISQYIFAVPMLLFYISLLLLSYVINMLLYDTSRRKSLLVLGPFHLLWCSTFSISLLINIVLVVHVLLLISNPYFVQFLFTSTLHVSP